jgi:hypothetical protein
VTKNAFGSVLGDFMINSSGHPDNNIAILFLKNFTLGGFETGSFVRLKGCQMVYFQTSKSQLG